MGLTISDIENFDLPDKVFVEPEWVDGRWGYEWSEDPPPALRDRALNVVNGFYGDQNLFTLFDSVPEIFAPINEIASRVADANWQLRKSWNDQIDDDNQAFNKLFTKPNPLQGIRDFIWQAVVYEILAGFELFYLNRPSNDILTWEQDPADIASWFNLPAQRCRAIINKAVDPYTAVDIKDYIKKWVEVTPGYKHEIVRSFDADNVMPVFNLSINGVREINNQRSLLRGAEIAIRNLIPVYEARGIIYIKRGALGFVVSNKSDMTGKVALSKGSKEDLRKEYESTYGVAGRGKSPLAFTDQPIDFKRTAMSIQEMQPFTETLMDAIAIYKVLRVPSHLVPREGTSTFDNAKSDMIDFYNSVVIPWAKKYADLFTQNMGFAGMKRFVVADFSHIDIMSENKKDKALIDKTNGDTWEKRFKNGMCTPNDWIRSWGGTIIKNKLYDKTLFDMEPEERELVISVISNKGMEATDGKKEIYDPIVENTKAEAK